MGAWDYNLTEEYGDTVRIDHGPADERELTYEGFGTWRDSDGEPYSRNEDGTMHHDWMHP